MGNDSAFNKIYALLVAFIKTFGWKDIIPFFVTYCSVHFGSWDSPDAYAKLAGLVWSIVELFHDKWVFIKVDAKFWAILVGVVVSGILWITKVIPGDIADIVEKTVAAIVASGLGHVYVMKPVTNPIQYSESIKSFSQGAKWTKPQKSRFSV